MGLLDFYSTFLIGAAFTGEVLTGATFTEAGTKVGYDERVPLFSGVFDFTGLDTGFATGLDTALGTDFTGITCLTIGFATGFAGLLATFAGLAF